MRNRLLAVLRGERNHDRLAGVLEELLPAYVERETDFDRLRGLAGMILPQFAKRDPGKRRLATLLDESLSPLARDPESAQALAPLLADLVVAFVLASGREDELAAVVDSLLPHFGNYARNRERLAQSFQDVLHRYTEDPQSGRRRAEIFEALARPLANEEEEHRDTLRQVVDVLLAVLGLNEQGRGSLARHFEEILPEYALETSDRSQVARLFQKLLPGYCADPENHDDIAVAFEDLLPRYGKNPAHNERIGTLVRQLFPIYAKRVENMDDVALLLEQILPPYVYWQWGEDTAFRRHFRRWQRAGFNLVPNHHYFPIPDLERIECLLDRVSALRGIDLQEQKQLALLESVFPQYREELEAFPDQPTGRSRDFFLDNPAFRHVDAHALHCMVRHHKPRRIIEVGSGYSTLVTAAACVRNQELDGVECVFIAIEPYPNDLFLDDIPGLTHVIEERLEDVGSGIFDTIGDGDILFIDSTHILATGSDVAQLYLEILPALKPGVLIHIHDIFLPGEYPRDWITKEHIFWNEQYLLQAFLSFNDSFEVVFAASFLHREHPDALAAAVPGFSPELHFPGSFWIRRIQ